MAFEPRWKEKILADYYYKVGFKWHHRKVEIVVPAPKKEKTEKKKAIH